MAIISLLFLSSSTGSPLQFFVDYMNSGNVSAYGPGLIHGTVNKPAVFTVNTKDAGEGRESSSVHILGQLCIERKQGRQLCTN